jgi:hypothetical protein
VAAAAFFHKALPGILQQKVGKFRRFHRVGNARAL